MKEDRELSMTQLMAAVWAGAIGGLGEFFAFPGAGTGGTWLLPLLALPVLLTMGWLLGRVSGGDGLGAGLCRGLGPVLGRSTLILYIVWAVLLAGAVMGRCALRLGGGGEGSPWFFLGLLVVAVLWMIRGEIGAFGRVAQGMLAALLVTVGAVLLLALPQADGTLLRPVGVRAAEWLRGIVSTVEILSPALYGAFLLGRTGEHGQSRCFLWWTVVGCAAGAAALAIIQSCLGPALSARMEQPLFTLTQGVGVEGAFQRAESLVITLWSGTDLMTALLLLRAAEEIGGALHPGWGGRIKTAVGIASALAAAIYIEGMPGPWLTKGAVFLFVIPAGAVLLLDVGRKETVEDSISCGERGFEMEDIERDEKG